MTNQEAIRNFKSLYMMADITDEYGETEDTTPYEKALNMAIEVLRSDCISREMARRIIDSGRTKEQMLESLKTAPDIVQELKNKGEIE